MGAYFQPPLVDHALSEIESYILPSLSQMLEGVLDAATMARAGVEPEAHGVELRRVVRELEQVTRSMESLRGSFPKLQPPEVSISA